MIKIPLVQDCLTRSAAARANRDATLNPWRIGASLLREGTNWNWHSEAGWVAPEEWRGEGPKARCIHCQVLSASQGLLGQEWNRQVSWLQPIVNPATQLLLCYCHSMTHSDVMNVFVDGEQRHFSYYTCILFHIIKPPPLLTVLHFIHGVHLITTKTVNFIS